MNNRMPVIFVLLVPLLGGCCGMTKIDAHGGGAGGIASLGALILGTTAMQRLCDGEAGGKQDDEDEPRPPPDTQPEAEEDAAESTFQECISGKPIRSAEKTIR